MIYFEPGATELHQGLNTSATPLNKLGEKALCPCAGVLAKLNASLR